MSGIEIAGLVLGAIPLLISAIEHYNDGLDPIKAFVRWRGMLEKAIRELWHEKTHYCQTTQNLLKGATTAGEMNMMLEDPRNHLWSDRDLKARLQEKSGIAYGNYIATTEDIEKIITVLSKHLNLDKSKVGRTELERLVIANPPTHPLCQTDSSFEFRKRLDFTMKRRDISRLLGSLKTCNERLESFLSRADKFDEAPISGSHFRCVFALPLPRIQDHASSVSNVLDQAWCCNLHTVHCANLLLEHRILESNRQKLRHDETIKFTFAFSDPSQHNKWADTEIEISSDSGAHQEPSCQRLTKITISAPTAQAPTFDISALPEISDICATITQSQKTPASIGFHIDSRRKLRGPYQVEHQRQPCEEFVTLEELFARTTAAANIRSQMSQRDSYLLAINLSSSLLQLHTTPWTAQSWTKKDIIFPTMAASEFGVDFQRPFLSLTYPPAPPRAPDPTQETQPDRTRLLKLGAMLLEIFCGQRVEDRRQEDLLGTHGTSVISELDLLLRWTQAKEKEGNLSFGSREAISNCLACFADPRTNLCDPTFRQGLVERIVTPLVVEWRHWQGIF